MARVTVEDCLEKVANRFELVILATKRARQLSITAAEPLVPVENDKPTVLALREIAEGLIDEETLRKSAEKSQIEDEEMEAHATLEANLSALASAAESSDNSNAATMIGSSDNEADRIAAALEGSSTESEAAMIAAALETSSTESEAAMIAAALETSNTESEADRIAAALETSNTESEADRIAAALSGLSSEQTPPAEEDPPQQPTSSDDSTQE